MKLMCVCLQMVHKYNNDKQTLNSSHINPVHRYFSNSTEIKLVYFRIFYVLLTPGQVYEKSREDPEIGFVMG